jgi:type II secretory pathway pseudopilin PulG
LGEVSGARPSTLDPRPAFTLVEVLVVMVLLSLIVLALMAVFSSTQNAFRASVTQTDVLEGGRAAMDLITGDLREMTPSFGRSNVISGPVNFCVTNYNYAPFYQSLVASSGTRTNVQQNFFILSAGNSNGVPMWYGTGYAVYLSPTNLYSLYRFSAGRPVASSGALSNLFYTDFRNFISVPNNYSHLLDGVLGFRIQAFDPNGGLIVTNRMNVRTNSSPDGTGLVFYSNALPASVEIEMATLEDRTLQRASTWTNSSILQSNYLVQQAGKVHVFRQRVSIPNVDPSAYQ